MNAERLLRLAELLDNFQAQSGTKNHPTDAHGKPLGFNINKWWDCARYGEHCGTSACAIGLWAYAGEGSLRVVNDLICDASGEAVGTTEFQEEFDLDGDTFDCLFMPDSYAMRPRPAAVAARIRDIVARPLLS